MLRAPDAEYKGSLVLNNSLQYPFNLETAVETRKSAQLLNMPKKPIKVFITNKVTSDFLNCLSTSVSYTSFAPSTEVSRIIKCISDKYHGLHNIKNISVNSAFDFANT